MAVQGQDHVRVALEVCQNVRDGLDGLAMLDEGWRVTAQQRVEAAQTTLNGLAERFFLRTKLCLPFAARCENEARRLEQALQGLGAQPGDEARKQFTAALEGLEKAVRTLDDRSTMQGTVIT